MPTMLSVLALSSSLLAAAAVAPKTPKPSKTAPAKPKTPKPAIPEDRVDTVPPVPSGLEVLFVAPIDFTVLSNVKLTPSFSLEPDEVVYEPLDARNGWAYAPVRLPVGATIEWFDCHFGFQPDSQAETGNARVNASLHKVGYAFGEDGPVTFVEPKTGTLSGKDQYATYWEGRSVPAAVSRVRRASAEATFVIEAKLESQHSTSFAFRGCRVGYRP